MACEILQKTRDGDNLAPRHLKLVENAVNGFLNDKGMAAFTDLHSDCMKGYKKPWFHDVEHLTIDHPGYVYWKGIRVEHYAPSSAYTDESKKSAQELGRRCLILEGRGEEISLRSVIWDWPD